MGSQLKPLDPDGIDWYFRVWCSKDGLNDGGLDDLGELQGATIASSEWTITPTGELVELAKNTAAITIRGIVYPVNTVAAIKVSTGIDDKDYQLTNRITTSDGRTLDDTLTIRVREQ